MKNWKHYSGNYEKNKSMLIYFVKIILLSMSFFVLFKGILANKTCFRFNRWFILAAVILAPVLPWFNAVNLFGSTGLRELAPVEIVLAQVTLNADRLQRSELSFTHILLAVYALGLLWGLARMLLGAYILRKIYRTGKLERRPNFKIIRHSQIEHPFSFWGLIFLPLSHYSIEEEKAILRHEEVHVQHLHSLEKILLTLLQTIFWFNPFYYFFHRELELQHEFEADAGTISGISKDTYLKFLGQQVEKNLAPTLLVQPFFQHPLKTRIKMMYQQNVSTKIARFLALSSLLVIVICFIGFQSMAQTQQKSTQEFPQKEQNPTLPEFPGGQNALMLFLSEKIKYPETDRIAKREGRTILQFTIDEQGTIQNPLIAKSSGSETLDREALRVLALMPSWKPGTMNGKAVKVEFKLPVSFVLK